MRFIGNELALAGNVVPQMAESLLPSISNTYVLLKLKLYWVKPLKSEKNWLGFRVSFNKLIQEMGREGLGAAEREELIKLHGYKVKA